MSTLSGKVLMRVYDNIHTLDGRQTEMSLLPCTIDKIDKEPLHWGVLL